ncbi:uncharacterized protein BDR25DRAFT_317230 [Lindgomyces ingoldianus]|uniref:Uncharacterized protein n=1 Tax=Lindgomyces ingoldianus TaxID=673940 RepID=A0ACB6QJ84_9PLEO|nr:uncharacterized protein BDR25DRAFT_317230 [Lindgomyces ingoldianus]KAF2466998.1 hypothetical protein BDR25DRAFT_317230 [Lindgomyces ingoldianus]
MGRDDEKATRGARTLVLRGGPGSAGIPALDNDDQRDEQMAADQSGRGNGGGVLDSAASSRVGGNHDEGPVALRASTSSRTIMYAPSGRVRTYHVSRLFSNKTTHWAMPRPFH